MNRLLLVGQAPARSAAPDAPAFYDTDSWRRFARICGRDEVLLARFIETANVVPFYPGRAKDGKHDAILAQPLARDLAIRLRYLATTVNPKPTHILLAGRWTTSIWQGHKTEQTFFTELPDNDPFKAYPVPHPGGTNMQLNEQALRTAYGAFMNFLLADAVEWTSPIGTLHKRAAELSHKGVALP